MNAKWRAIRIADWGEVKGGRQRSARITRGRNRPYLRVANVFDGYIDTTDVLEMPFTDEEFAEYALRPSDILINEGQSLELVGRSAIYTGPPETYAFQNTLIRFRPGPECDPHFAHAVFRMLWRRGVFGSISKQTTSIAHLGVKRFADLLVRVPPLSVQQRIAAVLKRYDRTLDLVQKLIAAKREFKRGLMQELLTGRRRFPEFGAPSTTQGRPPEGWRRTSLGEVATIRVSNVDKHYRPEHIPVRLCNYMDVWTRPYICDDQEFMRSTASPREVELFQLRAGDVLLTKDSETREEIAEPSVVLSAGNDLVLGYHLALVRPDPDLVDGRFLASQLRVPRFRQHFVRSAQGATRFGLTIDSLQRAEVWLPTVEEQRRIAELDLMLYREIEILEGLLDRFEAERRGLMRKLLTGELTVPVSSEPEPVHA